MRLDLAPSLNWLSRRSVLAAIYSGQLTVEPMQFTNLLEELAPPNIPASSHHTHIVCALCGMPIYSTHSDSPASTPTTPNSVRTGSQSASWSTTLFKNVRAGEINLPTPFTGQNRYSTQFGAPNTEPPSQLYIFRLEATSSGLPVSLPISSQQPSTTVRHSIYPLCTNGWCLARLRTTCSLWAFVRTSIVEKIWEEPPTAPYLNGNTKPGVNGIDQKHDGTNGVAAANGKPVTTIEPVPRRAKMGLGSLWGSMQRSLSGAREPEKEAPKSQDAEKKDERPKLPPRDPSRKSLPPPPPSHPSVSHAPKSSISSVHRVPPPFKENGIAAAPAPVPATARAPVAAAAPPPLPKRNRGRGATTPEPEAKAEANGVPNGDATAPSESVQAQSQPNEVIKIEAPATASEAPTQPSEDAASPAQEPIPLSQEVVPAPVTTEDRVDSKPKVVVPTSISRATSNDSFSTPTEELAPHGLDTTPAAITVPLPASQEPSPVTEETVPANELQPAAASEGAILTPALASDPVAATAAAVDDNNPPSRTGSPAPPPLPRRAAARARPSSTLVSQTTDQAKRDSVDVPPTTEATDASQETAVVADGAATPTPAPPAAPAEQAAPVTEEPEQIVETETETTAPTPAPAPVADPAVDSPDAPAPAAVEEEQPESDKTAPAAEEPRVNGDSKPSAPAQLEEAAAAAPAPAAAVGEKEQEAGSAVPAETETETEKVEEQVNGQYVGDATWEERTYKELVRLREEMFWARIGAVVH